MSEVHPLNSTLSRGFLAPAEEACVARTAGALKVNGITVLRAPDNAEAKRIILDRIPAGSQVHHGVVKTAADQIAVIGTLRSGATASVHVREAVAGGTGFLWEINGTDGTLRITADAAYPEIDPLTVWGARGRNEPAELAVPAVLWQKCPALTSLKGSPAYNVGRAYAAFVADIDNGSHTVPDFANALARHALIAAIERSAASGERVTA